MTTPRHATAAENPTDTLVAPIVPEQTPATSAPAAGESQTGGQPPKSGVERRSGLDRRVLDLGSPTGLERRRGPGLRRNDDRRAAEEGEMTDEQFEFVLAVDTYKRLNNRPFPTWTEILEVVKQLGYRKVAASTLILTGAVSRASSRTAQNPARATDSGADHSNQPETD